MPNEFDLDTLKETIVVRINPDESTLPIDTASEVTKGYALLNQLLYEVLDDKYVEEYIDEHGEERQRTHFHPWTLELLKERRRVLDQVWKMSGGEAMNEVKKEKAKQLIDLIFKGRQDESVQKDHKEKFIKEMEAKIENEES